MAWATRLSPSTSASGMCRRTISSASSGSPALAMSAPAASAAAIGAKTSRPWKVAADDSRRCGRARHVDRFDDAAEALGGEGQQAVVRADEDAVLVGAAQRDRAPLGPDLGVDHGQVDAGRAVRQRAPQDDRAGADVVPGDAVGHVDHADLGRRDGDHPVADADEVVVQAVVREEREHWGGHTALDPSRGATPGVHIGDPWTGTAALRGSSPGARPLTSRYVRTRGGSKTAVRRVVKGVSCPQPHVPTRLIPERLRVTTCSRKLARSR